MRWFDSIVPMQTFYMNEAAVELPDDAVDRSTTHVLLSTVSGVPATFEVERLDRAPDRSLVDDYASYLRDLRVRLRRFGLVFEQERLVHDVAALDVGVRWQNEDLKGMYTRQVHLHLPGTWLILAIEGALEAREELDELFEPIIASVRLRD